MKIRKIVFCTLRNNKGATGGPGGVLFLQQQTIGNNLVGIPCEYWFNCISRENSWWVSKLNTLLFIIKALFTRETYFITHDIQSGYYLSKIKKNYSLIFHQQGPSVEELLNFGANLSEEQIANLKRQERFAFTKAKSLHFPANGASEMYFNSKYASCTREEVHIKPAFYNIIPMVEPQKPESIDLDVDNERTTLFSLGTLTKAKGQDLTIDFIDRHYNAFGKPVRYIMVGKGPMRDQLLKQLDKIKIKHPEFTYRYYDGIPHDGVMYLHKISDVYIMLHRISIFDFATLEAMSQKTAIILSEVGGNKDFNMDDNIIFAEDVDRNEVILSSKDFNTLKTTNYTVFCNRFSHEAFVKQYENFIKTLI